MVQLVFDGPRDAPTEIHNSVSTTFSPNFLENPVQQSPAAPDASPSTYHSCYKPYIDFQGSDEKNSLTANLKVYEDLSKKHSDRYEFIYPYVQYSRLLNDENNMMNISYDLTTYQKKYDTDVYEG